MATSKRKKKPVRRKPVLIKCGNHYINPLDVSRILRVEKRHVTLYCVKFISEPNPVFATWVKEADIAILLDQFDITVTDSEMIGIEEDDPTFA